MLLEERRPLACRKVKHRWQVVLTALLGTGPGFALRHMTSVIALIVAATSFPAWDGIAVLQMRRFRHDRVGQRL